MPRIETRCYFRGYRGGVPKWHYTIGQRTAIIALRLLRLQLQNVLFDFLAACVGKPPILAADLKPAPFQHPDGGDVVFGDAGIEGTFFEAATFSCLWQDETGKRGSHSSWFLPHN
jgi:hypothetical protein